MPGMQQEDFIAWEKLLEARVQETIAGVEAQEREVQQEERLQERSAAVEAREQEVQREEARLQERSAVVEARERQVQQEEARLPERIADVEARERQVQQEESHLQERIAAVEAREQEVHRGERLLQQEMQPLGRDVQLHGEKVREAQRALDEAKDSGVSTATIDKASNLLEKPDPSHAAQAIVEIDNVRQKASQESQIQAIKAAERALRDVLVVRCHSRVTSDDRAAFIAVVEEAFGAEWSRDHRSLTLLSFHKVYKDKPTTFLSQNAVQTLRRGHPRLRRSRTAAVPQRTSSEEVEEAGGEEGETETETGPRHVNVPQQTRAIRYFQHSDFILSQFAERMPEYMFLQQWQHWDEETTNETAWGYEEWAGTPLALPPARLAEGIPLPSRRQAARRQRLGA